MNRSDIAHHIDRTGQAGLIGKAAAIWLLIIAVLGVGVIDAVSIARTTLHVSAIAAEAASDGAATWRSQGRSAVKACAAVAATVEAKDPKLKVGRNGCSVETTTGRVTVTIRATADTIIADRFGPTAEYAQVVITEVAGGSKL